ESTRPKNLLPLKVEGEATLCHPCPSHRIPQPLAILGIEHQKAAAAGSHELATERSAAPPQIIPFIYVRIGHTGGAAFLVFPMFVHKLAEQSGLSPLKRPLAAVAEHPHAMEIRKHCGVR